MTSYQKLKKKIAEQEAERVKLLDDFEYYLKERIVLGMGRDIKRQFWFGESKPNGEIKGLLGKLMGDEKEEI